jgi:hypothetical protein
VNKTIFAGISGKFIVSATVQVAIALRNETYLLDFLETTFTPPATESEVCDFILAELQNYRNLHAEKVLGAALPRSFHARCPSLCSQLWSELDIVPILLDEEQGAGGPTASEAVAHLQNKDIDEQAESLSRKCIRYHSRLAISFVHLR